MHVRSRTAVRRLLFIQRDICNIRLMSIARSQAVNVTNNILNTSIHLDRVFAKGGGSGEVEEQWLIYIARELHGEAPAWQNRAQSAIRGLVDDQAGRRQDEQVPTGKRKGKEETRREKGDESSEAQWMRIINEKKGESARNHESARLPTVGCSRNVPPE